MVYKHDHFFKRKMNKGKLGFQSHFSSHLWNCALVQLSSPFTALKIILIYVYGYEKRNPKHIFMDWMKIGLKN